MITLSATFGSIAAELATTPVLFQYKAFQIWFGMLGLLSIYILGRFVVSQLMYRRDCNQAINERCGNYTVLRQKDIKAALAQQKMYNKQNKKVSANNSDQTSTLMTENTAEMLEAGSKLVLLGVKKGLL